MDTETRTRFLLQLTLVACLLGALLLAGRAAACDGLLRPGEAFGPIRLGAPVAALSTLGLAVTPVSDHGDTAFLDVGPYRVRACGGRVREIWIDDLRTSPLCVADAAGRIEPHLAREAIAARLGDCRELPPRIGGAFLECAGGGVRLGYGLGDFLQVRVAARGSDLDEECADVLDDGRPRALPEAEQADLLQRTLDLDVLSPYWHPDRPGRRPLTILRTEAVVGTPALSIFGYPVRYAEIGEAQGPVFEFAAMESTARRVVVRFRFAPEGLEGEARFRRHLDTWQLESRSVRER